jgi:hypothetical protein
MNKNLFSVHKFLANIFTSDMLEFIKSLRVFIHPENTKENLCIQDFVHLNDIGEKTFVENLRGFLQ